LAIGLLLLFECLNIIHSSGVPMALPFLFEVANSIILDLESLMVYHGKPLEITHFEGFFTFCSIPNNTKLSTLFSLFDVVFIILVVKIVVKFIIRCYSPCHLLALTNDSLSRGHTSGYL
jgi:hypothetical protein